MGELYQLRSKYMMVVRRNAQTPIQERFRGRYLDCKGETVNSNHLIAIVCLFRFSKVAALELATDTKKEPKSPFQLNSKQHLEFKRFEI